MAKHFLEPLEVGHSDEQVNVVKRAPKAYKESVSNRRIDLPDKIAKSSNQLL